MRGYELLDKMELIDSGYVEEADKHSKKKKVFWLKWGVLAACLGIVSVGVWGFSQKNQHGNSSFESLQPIRISELNSGQGFEGYLCYNISELENGNPWSDNMEIKTLPVYKNDAYDSSGAGIPKGYEEGTMQKHLEETADLLGLEILSTESSRDGLFVTELKAETDQGDLVIHANGVITYFPTDVEWEISELVERYREFLDFQNPEVVKLREYTIYGEQNLDCKIYDAVGAEVEEILNYNFNYAQFAPTQDGKLFLIRKQDKRSLADELGDYPIISVKEATKLLVNGTYQTSVPYVFPGKEHIGKVELIYRTGSSEEYLLPYYRFYAELTNEELANGLKTYGAYYVPAVDEAYIKNMPTYGGIFN